MMDPIMEVINGICQKGDWVSDLFSGTLSVSLELKRNGYHVISNDINKFSYAYGRGFLVNHTVPFYDNSKLDIEGDFYANSLFDVEYKYAISSEARKNVQLMQNTLNYLNSLSIENAQRMDFFNHYTEEGKNSAFRSMRGQEGRRRYFSAQNGAKIDVIVNKIRFWWKSGVISDDGYYLLLCILMDAVERVSNTQGTYHDFPRNEYDSRALKPIQLRMPDLDYALCSDKEHILGRQQDSMVFVKEIPKHKLLYLDPPYNFRQYTSYYFMLNLLSDYAEIEDLDAYFTKVQHVRGQNMASDFTSTFCKSSLFIPSLKEMISNAKSEYVVMSYFDGRNHLNGKTPQEEHLGIKLIEDLFSSSLFKAGSYKLVPIKRLNYQSYGGHRAKELNEYLFIAKKK